MFSVTGWHGLRRDREPVDPSRRSREVVKTRKKREILHGNL